ncbi:hypothetical protein PR048_026822 [Dryococelus australis]|uniref:Uncharacterized protein n=1 Tax=Dryococelus australis TaxID=614101 RepID=A0ABQ9GMF9_9NEOP|nr:hypothetical protein PR048_026822 [Dryococelus australis]
MKMVKMSHGNAQVEIGLSENEDCIIENVREPTMVARQTTYYVVSSFGDVAKLKLPVQDFRRTKNVIVKTKQGMKKVKEGRERQRSGN